jgi:uncharacterized membrane protein
MAVSERDRATSNRASTPAPFAPKDFARDVAPLVAASAATASGIFALRHSKPGAALRAARFVNLMLASLLAGNGVGGERFVHAPLRKLRPGQFLAAEQAITRSYLPMLVVMPASVLSGALVLALMPRRRGVSFWLTAVGALGMLGTFVTTLVELPLNRQTLMASSDTPDGWLQNRSRWERFNHLRTAWEVAGWTCLCPAALTEKQR